jgi:glycosyltransferase involved in cell wall biosynthesis
MTLISVILPTYNRASFLPGAIESVQRQTFQDFELIIIDDGSTDDTHSVVNPYLKDKRIRYLLQQNGGAAAARNHGLAERQGKYVAFIDSDDTWEEDKLALQWKVLNQLPDVGIVCSDFSSVDDE